MNPAAEPPRPRARNRRGEGSRLRAEILAAATELVDAGRDPRSLTLRAIARTAGITAPSIYAHFLDPPAIVLGVVRQAFAELAGRIRAALDNTGGDSRQRLYTVCRAYLEFARRHPERYRAMFGGTWNSTATSAELAELGAEALHLLAGCLADCVAAGHCTSTDPAADAVALWLGLHGLAHQRAVHTSFRWPEDIVQRIAFPLSHLG
ncbi:TetR/AcrR family transcriptional regulator [Amycolatopsis sp. NPDC051758]|uniref:TetR/AcrR family transcriptional regulator n=1 Tax=Amycolatopsis sp. NPDC051758 TaxID=3363935 RepID=UPI0037960985